jgi:hypothetical protein
VVRGPGRWPGNSIRRLTGERRLRLIEVEQEYRRVRRLHCQADENLLRALRDDLEDRLQSAPTIMTSHLAEPHSTGRGSHK